jgi:hypothetical protein
MYGTLHLYCVHYFSSISPHTDTVQLSRPTADLLASLDAFSGHKLKRRDDLGTLIELASINERDDLLKELSFFAKVISKTHGIMQRIGVLGEGYDRISQEFAEAIRKSTSLMSFILAGAPEAERQRFASSYLALTPTSLQDFLLLCYDLSWYKNWMIDHPHPEKD